MSRRRHKCFIPSCPNSVSKTQDKMFIYVNDAVKRRYCNLLGIAYNPQQSLYCCEDHLDLQEDLDNYYQWKFMNARPRLKPTATLRYSLENKPSHAAISTDSENYGVQIETRNQSSSELYKMLLQPIENMPSRTFTNVISSTLTKYPEPVQSSDLLRPYYLLDILTTSGHRSYLNRLLSKHRDIERSLQESLKYDKGMGCEIPLLDPFSKEMMTFNVDRPKVTCGRKLSWVKCYLSKCKAVEKILNSNSELKCTYKDILYHDDNNYTLGSPTVVIGDGVYHLEKSDHVKIQCTLKSKGMFLPTATWTGHGVGYRKNVEIKSQPAYGEDSIDILIFGFDSTSKNGFIRKMPKSYEYLKNELGATFLNGYTILGDGTPAALFPLLSGKNELEFPDARRKTKKKEYLNADEFIFSKLKFHSYRTAYYEDSPEIGTFQYRFHGFPHQPADHYLRVLLQEDQKMSRKYCFGDTPLYNVMMNLTEQFFKLPGKHYIFTFIVDICHDDFNQISTADDDTVNFLKNLKQQGVFENTMMVFMGDHGPRYSNVRQTIQGKYEERLPLMSILLPKVLKARRPKLQAILESNTNVLTTAHDIYATVLDALDLTHLRNTYRIKGADMDRALTLFQPIPKNRSCSTAGIEAHWCVCLSWDDVTHTDVLYHRTANAFVDYVNLLTEEFRSKCVPRTLSKISWVMKQRVNNKLMTFVGSADMDGFKKIFNKKFELDRVFLQIKVTLGPSNAVFEASTTYLKKEDKFIFNTRDISRTNMYNNEPDCISANHPELNMFCHCK